MTLTVSVPRLATILPHAEMEWSDDGANFIEHNPAQETTVSYHNNLDVAVWVCERNGAVQQIQPRQGNERVFGVRVSRRFHVSTLVSYDLSQMVESRIGAPRPDTAMHALAESYNPAFSGMTGMGVSKDIVFKITKRQLEEYGGAIYHSATDIVVSFTREKAIHPGSPQANLAGLYDRFMEGCGSLGLSGKLGIFIIDNEQVCGNKYVNLGGVVHLVRAMQSSIYPNGLYVLRDAAVNDKGMVDGPVVFRYRLEEASETGIGLYNSRDQALKLGNPERVAEERLAALKAENLELKQKLENQILESKQSAIRQQDEYEEKALRRKDYYEDRSHRRKDDSEDMKYVFAAIAGFFGLLAVIYR